VGARRQWPAGGARRLGRDVEDRGAHHPAGRVAAHGPQHALEQRQRRQRRRRRRRRGTGVGRRLAGRWRRRGAVRARAVGARAGRRVRRPCRVRAGVGAGVGAAERAHGRRVHRERAAHDGRLLAGEQRRTGEREAEGGGRDAEQVGELPRVDVARVLERLEPRDERRRVVAGRRSARRAAVRGRRRGRAGGASEGHRRDEAGGVRGVGGAGGAR
jgi:hypothetical protein